MLPDVFFGGVTEHLHLSRVGPEDPPVLGDAMQPNGGGFQKSSQLSVFLLQFDACISRGVLMPCHVRDRPPKQYTKKGNQREDEEGRAHTAVEPLCPTAKNEKPTQ